MEEEWKARTTEVIEEERTTPIFLFRDDGGEVEEGEKPIWGEAWALREGAMRDFATTTPY